MTRVKLVQLWNPVTVYEYRVGKMQARYHRHRNAIQNVPQARRVQKTSVLEQRQKRSCELLLQAPCQLQSPCGVMTRDAITDWAAHMYWFVMPPTISP